MCRHRWQPLPKGCLQPPECGPGPAPVPEGDAEVPGVRPGILREHGRLRASCGANVRPRAPRRGGLAAWAARARSGTLAAIEMALPESSGGYLAPTSFAHRRGAL